LNIKQGGYCKDENGLYVQQAAVMAQPAAAVAQPAAVMAQPAAAVAAMTLRQGYLPVHVWKGYELSGYPTVAPPI
jgi:hypothetical protein